MRLLADAAPGIVAGEPPPALPHSASEDILDLQRALADAAERTRAAARDGMERDIDELDGIVGQFIDYVRDGREEPLEEVDLVALLHVLVADEARQGRAWQLSSPVGPGSAAVRWRCGGRWRICSITLTAMAPCRSKSSWRLTVADRGPGVQEAALSGLGRPFHRVDRARGASGSGLGLASVARVAALHGGGLILRNRDGGGLEAVLRLHVTTA